MDSSRSHHSHSLRDAATARTSYERQALKRDQHRKHTLAFDESFPVEDDVTAARSSSGGVGGASGDSNSSEEFQIGTGSYSGGASRKSIDSDDDLHSVSIHQRLFGQSGDFRSSFAGMENDMTSGDDCEAEEEEFCMSGMTSSPSSSNHRSLARHQMFNGSVNNNSGVGLRHGAAPCTYGSYSYSTGARSSMPYYGSTFDRSAQSHSAATTGSVTAGERNSSYDREVRFRRQSDYTSSLNSTSSASARAYQRTAGSGGGPLRMTSSSAPTRHADQQVNFGLHASSTVRIEKSELPTTTTSSFTSAAPGSGLNSSGGTLDRPIFGSKLNVREIERQSMKLIQTDRWRNERIDNLPDAAPITQQPTSVMTSSKKKKKRGGKKGKPEKLFPRVRSGLISNFLFVIDMWVYIQV